MGRQYILTTTDAKYYFIKQRIMAAFKSKIPDIDIVYQNAFAIKIKKKFQYFYTKSFTFSFTKSIKQDAFAISFKDLVVISIS